MKERFREYPTYVAVLTTLIRCQNSPNIRHGVIHRAVRNQLAQLTFIFRIDRQDPRTLKKQNT